MQRNPDFVILQKEGERPVGVHAVDIPAWLAEGWSIQLALPIQKETPLPFNLMTAESLKQTTVAKKKVADG